MHVRKPTSALTRSAFVASPAICIGFLLKSGHVDHLYGARPTESGVGGDRGITLTAGTAHQSKLGAVDAATGTTRRAGVSAHALAMEHPDKFGAEVAAAQAVDEEVDGRI